MKSNLIDLSVILHHETAKAFLVSDDGDKDKAVWIAKSTCEIEPKGKVWTLTLPEWVATQKGLV